MGTPSASATSSTAEKRISPPASMRCTLDKESPARSAVCSCVKPRNRRQSWMRRPWVRRRS